MSMDDSKFNMWRTITSLAHTDGVFCRDEKNYLIPIFDNLVMSDEQRQILKSDVETPQDPETLFALITKPADRAQVTFYGRVLLWADQTLDTSEQDVLAKMTELAMGKIDDTEMVMKKANNIIEDFKAQEKQRRDDRPFHRKVLDAIVFWEDLP